jgi:hypothetical protein
MNIAHGEGEGRVAASEGCVCRPGAGQRRSALAVPCFLAAFP